jgi:hypothetical protein
MPWIVQKNGDKFCVYKKGADGNAAGDSLHCYEGDDAEEKAKNYMKALYAHADDMQVHLSGESLDQRATAVREGFVKTFQPQYQEPERDSYCYIREIYDDYVIVDNGGKLYKVTYTKSDNELTFAPRDKWQAVKIDYVDMSFMDKLFKFLGLKPEPTHAPARSAGEKEPQPHQDLWAFSFTELAASHKAIDGLAANDEDPYLSMTGQEVYIKSGDLAAYVKNTLTVIESTQTESGEIVGLPIDLEAHNHKGGAGWIVGLELDQARSVIRFLVNWTEKGIELIKGNLSRFFSPSVDTENKIILGGSLTNWPASRNAKGQILLRPVELSQSIKEIDMEKTLLDMLAELPGKVAEAVRGGKPADPPATPPVTELETEISPELKELLRTPEAIEALGKKSQEMAREAIHLEKRKMHTVHFASKLAGGTAEHPVGLKVRPNEVVALLLSLPEPQALAVEKILASALDGAINFSMRGLDGNGFIQKPELPKEVKGYLKTWVEAGKSVDEFFKLNLELGNPEDYNLAEFKKKEA